eukprot:364265-Chlamydomonas_euryale.AAC.1
MHAPLRTTWQGRSAGRCVYNPTDLGDVEASVEPYCAAAAAAAAAARPGWACETCRPEVSASIARTMGEQRRDSAVARLGAAAAAGACGTSAAGAGAAWRHRCPPGGRPAPGFAQTLSAAHVVGPADAAEAASRARVACTGSAKKLRNCAQFAFDPPAHTRAPHPLSSAHKDSGHGMHAEDRAPTQAHGRCRRCRRGAIAHGGASVIGRGWPRTSTWCRVVDSRRSGMARRVPPPLVAGLARLWRRQQQQQQALQMHPGPQHSPRLPLRDGDGDALSGAVACGRALHGDGHGARRCGHMSSPAGMDGTAAAAAAAHGHGGISNSPYMSHVGMRISQLSGSGLSSIPLSIHGALPGCTLVQARQRWPSHRWASVGCFSCLRTGGSTLEPPATTSRPLQAASAAALAHQQAWRMLSNAAATSSAPLLHRHGAPGSSGRGSTGGSSSGSDSGGPGRHHKSPAHADPDASASADAAAAQAVAIEAAGERMSDFEIVRRLAHYLWPADNAEFKQRVVASGMLLVAAKVVNVSIPIILKYAIDAMSDGGAATPLALGSIGLVVAYGGARAVTALLSELRNVIFSK